jgi:4-carboxymuconolactone decarboxylase
VIRFPVLDRAAMSTRQKQVADEIAAGPRGALKGPFQILIHNPELASRLQAVGEHLRFGTTLSKILLEIAILVVARRWTCQYEWFAHARLAREAGVRDTAIMSISRGEIPDDMTEDEALVYRFCRETSSHGQAADQSFEMATERFGLDGVLDLIAICGYYSLLAMVLNTAQPELPPAAPTLQALAGSPDG